MTELQQSSRPSRPFAPRPTTQIAIGCVVVPVILALVIFGILFYVRTHTTAQLTVPKGDVAFVRTLPEETAPLIARFGSGRALEITGRTEDWRWLEVRLWDDRQGWILRPLDILVWRLDADVVVPNPPDTQPEVVTSVEEAMLSVPATSFTMGSPTGLGEVDETPAHPVSISAFEIDRTEVTVGQYWQCIEAEACEPPTRDASNTVVNYLNDPAYDNYPMVNVAWTEANNYCLWRGKRLPTEAEWELAAGWDIDKNAKFLWPWGSDPTSAEVNAGETSLGQAAPVGSFAEDISPVGALDMGGNVSEWVFDWYKADYYKIADDTDPIGPSQRRGEGTGRVVRGGSFNTPIEEARTANRRNQADEYGYPDVGFRCARDG
ncbi:MAG: SUMF1/EgtB/PvdO family nonheme iron enzyme [Anaerolineae bacterium]|nr:SUMF1/EgtB/PvdO family nonheme iron enzyme [Anaerolineae bacterium]